MQRIPIPVYFQTPESKQSETLGLDVPDSELMTREVFLFTDKFVAFYPRIVNGVTSGTTIETITGYYHTPLTPKGFNQLLNEMQTDEFVQDLRDMGFKGAEDLIPPNFDDEINNMLRPGGN